MSLNEKFVEDLFELCQKHKQNIQVKIYSRSDGVDHYEVDINGAWGIRKDYDAVEVYAVPFQNKVMSIKGTEEI